MSLSESGMALVYSDHLDATGIGNENEGFSSGYDSATENSGSDSESSGNICVPIKTSNSSNERNEEMVKYRSTHELCSNLRYILSLPDLCDVTFLVGERQIPICGLKAVLATRSRMFYNLILQSQRSKQESKKSKKTQRKSVYPGHILIEMKNYLPADFKALIQFVHCGMVDINTDNVTGLYCGASEFGLTDLKVACRDFTTRCIKNGEEDQILKSAKSYKEHSAVKRFVEKIKSYNVNSCSKSDH